MILLPPTITLKVSGSLLDAPGVATLAHTLREAPDDARLVLVHGGGPQLDEALAKVDEPVRHHEGLRVTSRAQAGVVQATLDRLGSQIAGSLSEAGVPAEHVDGLERALVAKPKRLGDGVDLGRVGTPVRFRAESLPAPPTVPVVTPVGTDGTGPLNVNADEAALAVAEATDSRALVFATSAPGVLSEAGQVLDRLDPPHAERLLKADVACGGMRPKLQAALEAHQAGVEETLIAPLAETIVQAALDGTAALGTRVQRRAEVPP